MTACAAPCGNDQLVVRDLKTKSYIAAAIGASLLLWFLFVPVGKSTASTIGNLLVPLLPVWWCLIPGRAFRQLSPGQDDQPRIRRWACVVVALGILCYPLGSAIDYYYALQGEDPFPSAADYFYFASYLFLFPGTLLVATRGTSTIARGRLLLDSALTVVALSTFSWYFLLGPILHEGSDSLLETVLSAAYPVFDLLMLFCVLFVSGRISGGHAKRVVVPLALGVLANITADTVWGYKTLNETYELGDPVDAGWPIAFLLTGLALRAHLLAPFAVSPDVASASTEPVPSNSTPLWRALLPYALVPSIVGLIVYDYHHGEVDAFYHYGIYGGSLLLLVLLLARQLLSIQENTALNRQLQSTLNALNSSNQSLASANAKMIAINRASIDGVMVLNRNWQIEEFNAAAEQMLGVTAKGASGRSLRELFQLPADEHSLLGNRTEVVGVRANGSTLPVELAVVAVELDGPSIFVAFVRDLTHQKEAEAIREDLHKRLMAASRQAGMAEVATGVLHNVGNVLNSVNVSATLVSQKLKQSEVASLKRAAELITAHKDDLGSYITSDKRGQQLPSFLVALSKTLADEQTMLLSEASSLAQGLEHIKSIIQSQQAHAKDGILLQEVTPAALVDAAVKMHVGSFANHDIRFTRQIEVGETVRLDQHKVLQILVNLISNAKQAVKINNAPAKMIHLTVDRVGERIRFRVNDNGIGIEPHLISKIFAHGFTTREDGHGFGLHSAATLAQEMGGSLVAESDGKGKGATFTLELPAERAANVAASISSGGH